MAAVVEVTEFHDRSREDDADDGHREAEPHSEPPPSGGAREAHTEVSPSKMKEN